MTCAFAVRGALKKFPGVESVDVSLNKGLAAVKLKPGNAVTPDRFWEAVKKNGFTPKETHVVVRGEVTEKMQLKVTGTSRTYELDPHGSTTAANEVKRLSGKTVTVEGMMMPGKGANAPIQVQKVRE